MYARRTKNEGLLLGIAHAYALMCVMMLDCSKLL
ncbi:MAG: hypothetical protein ACI89D_000484 [Bermanella sp.]|jgi:hypothetical protein